MAVFRPDYHRAAALDPACACPRLLAGVRGNGPSRDLRVNHVRLCGQATLAAKVGVFLEWRQAVLGVSRTVLERLRRMRPKQPHYLDRRLGGKMAPGWNLMVPPALLGGKAGIDP